MINRLIAVSLLIVMISNCLSRFFIYAEFKANQKYIAAVLCENKEKPKMHCNGKCYLMKKLKQAEEKEKKQQQSEQKKAIQDYFILSEGSTEPAMGFYVHQAIAPYLVFTLPQISFDIPHPPPLSV